MGRVRVGVGWDKREQRSRKRRRREPGKEGPWDFPPKADSVCTEGLY